MKKILLFLMVISIFSCTKGQNGNFFGTYHDGIDPECVCPALYDYCGGGRVVYIFQPGDNGYVSGECHGIIASTVDIAVGIQWYNGYYTSVGGTNLQVGYGALNTLLIVASQGTGSYAAQVCNDLTLNGYSDWYLPSSVEMKWVWVQVGGMSSASGSYWTSSQINSTQAGYETPPEAALFYGDKATLKNVRAIRYY